MNKTAIKAELRRSACEDEDPASGINDDSYIVAKHFQGDRGESPYGIRPVDDCRTFFLLVAEAL